MRLQDIRPRDIDRMVKELATKGLAKNSIQVPLRIAHVFFKYAIYPMELIQINPTEYIEIPKTAKKKVVERAVVSREKFNELLDIFPIGHRFRIPIVIAYYTGMRLGEILGLTWDDISLSDKTINISRQLCPHTNITGLYFDTPKTATSNRVVYIGDALVAELRQWKNLQNTQRLKLGRSYQIAYELPEHRALLFLPRKDPVPSGAQEHALVCTNDFGIAVNRNSLSSRLSRIGVNSHSFRHTHATRLIEAGAKAVDVAARLGHTDATITQNLYTHDTEQMQKETAALTDKVL